MKEEQNTKGFQENNLRGKHPYPCGKVWVLMGKWPRIEISGDETGEVVSSYKGFGSLGLPWQIVELDWKG